METCGSWVEYPNATTGEGMKDKERDSDICMLWNVFLIIHINIFSNASVLFFFLSV